MRGVLTWGILVLLLHGAQAQDGTTTTSQPTGDAAPSRVGELEASAVTETTILVSWRVSGCNPDTTLFYRDVRDGTPSPTPSAQDPTWQHVEGLTNGTYTIEGLTPQTAYHIAAQATDDCGSPWSPPMAGPICVRTDPAQRSCFAGAPSTTSQDLDPAASTTGDAGEGLSTTGLLGVVAGLVGILAVRRRLVS